MDTNVDSSWLLMNPEKSLDTLLDLLLQVHKSQQESALALQKLLSTLSDKMERVEKRTQVIHDRLVALESRVHEQDVREQNRRIRTHDAFSFRPQHTANP
jgi:hypothetical protein